jgi:hypothetical protein
MLKLGEINSASKSKAGTIREKQSEMNIVRCVQDRSSYDWRKAKWNVTSMSKIYTSGLEQSVINGASKMGTSGEKPFKHRPSLPVCTLYFLGSWIYTQHTDGVQHTLATRQNIRLYSVESRGMIRRVTWYGDSHLGNCLKSAMSIDFKIMCQQLSEKYHIMTCYDNLVCNWLVVILIYIDTFFGTPHTIRTMRWFFNITDLLNE